MKELQNAKKRRQGLVQVENSGGNSKLAIKIVLLKSILISTSLEFRILLPKGREEKSRHFVVVDSGGTEALCFLIFSNVFSNFLLFSPEMFQSCKFWWHSSLQQYVQCSEVELEEGGIPQPICQIVCSALICMIQLFYLFFLERGGSFVKLY